MNESAAGKPAIPVLQVGPVAIVCAGGEGEHGLYAPEATATACQTLVAATDTCTVVEGLSAPAGAIWGDGLKLNE
jgi:hypothetical protein